MSIIGVNDSGTPSRDAIRSRTAGTCSSVRASSRCASVCPIGINRIAADDDCTTVMAVFEKSLTLNYQVHAVCRENGIVILTTESTQIVRTQLYGYPTESPVLSWT